MTKLKKFDPQNRKKDMNHEELREFRIRNKPIPKERAGANRQRFMNMVAEEDDTDNDDDVYPYDIGNNDDEFHTQTN